MGVIEGSNHENDFWNNPDSLTPSGGITEMLEGFGKIVEAVFLPNTSEDSRRFVDMSATEVLQLVNPGEIIFINRGMYSHVGTYVGDGKIVHADGNIKFITVTIKEDHLEAVSKGDPVCIKNLDDIALKRFGLTPKAPEQIVVDAKASVNKEVVYNAFQENCEFRATEFRFGHGFSTQAEILNENAMAPPKKLNIISPKSRNTKKKSTNKKSAFGKLNNEEKTNYLKSLSKSAEGENSDE